MMKKHFFINTVNTFYTSLNLRLFAEFTVIETFGNVFFDSCNKCFTLTFFNFKYMFDLRICKWVKIMERSVLQFFLYSPHSQAMCYRGVYIHCFMCGFALFYSRPIIKSSHVMQSVCKFYNNYSYVL